MGLWTKKKARQPASAPWWSSTTPPSKIFINGVTSKRAGPWSWIIAMACKLDACGCLGVAFTNPVRCLTVEVLHTAGNTGQTLTPTSIRRPSSRQRVMATFKLASKTASARPWQRTRQRLKIGALNVVPFSISINTTRSQTQWTTSIREGTRRRTRLRAHQTWYYRHRWRTVLT